MLEWFGPAVAVLVASLVIGRWIERQEREMRSLTARLDAAERAIAALRRSSQLGDEHHDAADDVAIRGSEHR